MLKSASPPQAVPSPVQQMPLWLQRVDNIVSMPGGLVEASEQQRRLALLFADGVLLVDGNAPHHPQILALREVAQRKGIRIRHTYPVPIELIRQLYEAARQKQPAGGDTAGFSTPMQRALLALLHEAVGVLASDIHIYVHSHEADIKFRVRGDMRHIRQIDAKTAHELLAAAYNMADAADATYRLYDFQAARIASSAAPLPKGLQAVRLQLNPMGAGGRYLVARLLYAQERWDDNRPSLESLRLHPAQLRALSRMRQVPEGVNIISGPTGSGKSTTLKIVLEALYREREGQINILTIEDPPEYEIHGAAQLPVTNADGEEERGGAYRQAIIAALRSDPDVIMPGEARDREVIRLVFTAAMTGHQVWTSLHANSAIAIFDRLRDQGVEPYKLSDPNLITGLMAQRLVKMLCTSCRRPLAGGELAELAMQVPRLGEVAAGFHREIHQANPQGCPACTQGYSGRTVLAEVICPDQTFLDYMQRGERQQAQRHWAEALDGLSMMEHGWLHMIAGNVDPRDLVACLGPLQGLGAARRQALIALE
ncbi:MAG: Flp pilus assembly complex ATPase component TadA [Paludibacterium sp.]|uniref:GspE/PulE family protein n=1 Tax=Paludibacterium sp. TaxID=1917523 RepID=UPI0025F3B3F5|nr:ATPase, T2SS/T4P/T4SS family [Paludibacterium sp.]MBV8046446.1 Flp pilus assembly complex ATPase component TadA [Paludibacterium sp.]